MAAVAPPLLEAPNAIPGYLLDELIARRIGSWSVFRARDLVRGRTVALRIFGSHLNHDPDYGPRFEREMPRVAELGHPNLVQVLDAGRARRGLYLVTELEDTLPLDAALTHGVLDTERAIRLLGPIADALDHAHKRGLVHRGVSPESIVVAEGRHALLADFALADPVSAVRGPDAVKPAFLAPELVEGAKATPRSDVFGLAATFFWILTGAAPPSLHPLTGSPASGPDAAHGSRESLPPEIEQVLRSSLAVDPGRRPSAGKMVSELERAMLPPGARPVTLRNGSLRGGAPVLPSGGAVAEVPGRAARDGAVRARSAADAAPLAASKRVRRRRRAVVGVLGVAALAAAVGSLAAREAGLPADSSSERPGRTVASTRELTLSVPASWSLANDVTEIAGLPLDESLELLPRRAAEEGQDAGLLVGVVRQADDRLLPPGFSSRVTTEPVAERVQVGRYAGYRYAGLVLRGTNQQLNLYTVPTAQGAATLVCFARSGGGAFLRRCEAVATTLELTGLEAKPLAPNSGYVAALNATLRRLNARRRAGRAALRDARTPAGQAREADGLARAFVAAARELSRAPRRLDDPEAGDRLVMLLRDVGGAYAAMARGARRGSRSDFSAATDAVARRERRLRKSLDALRRGGVSPGP